MFHNPWFKRSLGSFLLGATAVLPLASTADAGPAYLSLTNDKRVEFFDANGDLLGDAAINLPPVAGADYNGIAVGDIDASNPGLELIVTRDNVVDIFTMPTPGGPAVNRLKFNNLGSFGGRENLSIQAVDFDSSNPGLELVTFTDDIDGTNTSDNYAHVYEGQGSNSTTLSRLTLTSLNYSPAPNSKLGAVAADLSDSTAGLEFATIRADGFIETYDASGNRIHVFRKGSALPTSIDVFDDTLMTMEGNRLDFFTFDGVNQPTYVGDLTLNTTSTLVDTIKFPIPEPASAALIAMGLFLLCPRRSTSC